MQYFIVEVNDTHIGIEFGPTKADARRHAREAFGRGNVRSVKVRNLNADEVKHIVDMDGYVPPSVREQFGLTVKD